MNELALFAGSGGGILGGILLGWRTRCAVEIDPYCRRVLLTRQRDGILPRFPIWDEVRTFDGAPWRGHIDIVTGGFPCQDISVAGRGAGITGERSGLWKEMARIVGEVRPRYVLVENSPALTHRGMGAVLGDLASMGYDAEWCVLGADDVGAPHRRQRIWILGQCSHVPDRDCSGFQEQWRPVADATEHATPKRGRWWGAEPGMGRVANGLAYRVDRVRSLGNGQVPRVVSAAFNRMKSLFDSVSQNQNKQLWTKTKTE